MYRVIIFVFLILTISLEADFEKHLKKIIKKTKGHTIRNVDFIYMINLDHRTEKWADSINQLAPYNIIPFRFSGIYGKNLSNKVINDIGVKYSHWMDRKEEAVYLDSSRTFKKERPTVIGRTYFSPSITFGALGIILGHLSIIKDALDSNYNTIWVMEDDIEVIQDPHLISDMIDHLDDLVGKEGWDILFTDKNSKDVRGNLYCIEHAWRPNFFPPNPARFSMSKMISDKIMKIGARYGAYSMIIRRSGMKKIYNFIKTYQIFLPYDMEYILPDHMQMFTVIDDIVSTNPHAISDNKPSQKGSL